MNIYRKKSCIYRVNIFCNIYYVENIFIIPLLSNTFETRITYVLVPIIRYIRLILVILFILSKQ